MALMKELVAKFPDVRITTTAEGVEQLKEQGITATSSSSDGIVLFEAPHEDVQPLFPVPQEIGVHYLDLLTHPGDSHNFSETKDILALPVTAPWGSTTNGAQLAMGLKPKYIVPIHDWHWRDEARKQMYDALEEVFAKEGITFLNIESGTPIVVDV
jgi:hypothetical protein